METGCGFPRTAFRVQGFIEHNGSQKMSRPLAFMWKKRKQQLRPFPRTKGKQRLLFPPLLSGFAVSVVAHVHKKPLRPGSTQRVTKGCFRGHSRHHHTSNRAIEGMYSLSRRKIRRTRHTGFDCPMQQKPDTHFAGSSCPRYAEHSTESSHHAWNRVIRTRSFHTHRGGQLEGQKKHAAARGFFANPNGTLFWERGRLSSRCTSNWFRALGINNNADHLATKQPSQSLCKCWLANTRGRNICVLLLLQQPAFA